MYDFDNEMSNTNQDPLFAFENVRKGELHGLAETSSDLYYIYYRHAF